VLIAVLADIHGNREAFDACLDHARRMRAERFVILGDLVGYGADPGYVVDQVKALAAEGAVVLKGNHDEAVVARPIGMTEDALAAALWSKDQLSPEQRSFLAGLPLTAEEGERLFVHANAWAPERWGYVLDRRDAERSLRATDRRITLCAHVHAPALYASAGGRRAVEMSVGEGEPVPLVGSRRWLAVIGSVGQPRDGRPEAAYAVLHAERPVLTMLRVPYAVERAAAKIRAAGLPARLAERLFRGE
jgi:diadenosine tetraphosphatase ApaH/serine/threonine PP2A family protein phosphatase